ncbi:carboxypeptidase regulatory-like domain-containing protein [Actinoplanes sp. NPDC049599]|uniref:carboxypeptidase regulatory-like domain-containing protein n=1 Tax=Actinoplanes sp. NPDC049599 TaxID=3363903 RepID=UPI00378CFC33
MSRIRLARLGSAVAVGMLVAGAFAAPALAATGTVQGVFTTSAGAPIAGASVTAYSGEGDWLKDTTTNSAGSYRLTGVTAGGVQLQFNNNGLEHWSPGVTDQEHATTYPLAAGGTLTVNEKQPATGTIAGHFSDASGEPVPYANITVRGIGSWAWLYGSTDEQGAYSVEALPGTYKVSFKWESAEQWAVQAADEDAATAVTVTAGQTTTVDDHKLPTGTVSGHLTASDGSPLTDARITLHRGQNQVGSATTGEEGNYSLGEALAGDGYTVSYSVGGGPDIYVPGTADPAKAREFTVVAGQQITVDDIQPLPATVHGTLTGDDGGPKAGYQVTVALASNDNWIQLNATTDADGTWTVRDVSPGDYRVSFVGPDGGRSQWAYGKSTEGTATLIPVPGGGDITVDDTWLPGATLVVNAVDASTGAPVSDYCVWITSPGDGSGCATSGSQITVTDLPGGTYQMSANPGEGSYYLSTDFQPVTLTPGETTTATIKLALGGKVSFTATDHVSGAAVNRVCPAFAVLGHGGLPDGYGDCTDTTGKATSTSMAAGTYEMYAVAPTGYGDQWVGRNGGTGEQKAAARIKVVPGKTVSAPAVLLDKAGTITGMVTDAAGKPLAGMDVAWSAWGDAGPSWDTDTDAQGRYTITDLGPYAWPLLFSGAGYPRQWSGHVGNRYQAETVPVLPSGTTTYNFTPVAGSTLKGKVTAPAGATWRIHAFNAATGDQMGTFDSSAAGPGGTYELKVIGSQQVKVDWSWYIGENDHHGWHHNATDIDTATKVGIPANGGTKKLNLTLS